MEILNDQKTKYDIILNRIQKNGSNKEGFLLIIKQYLTNNIVYYIIYVLLRFIPLIILTGNYHETFMNSDSPGFISASDSKWVRNITIHKLINLMKIGESTYICISLLLFVLFIIRLILYLLISNGLKNNEINNKWPIPTKYQIVMDHIVFLFFPYIIEFLSFIYFIIFTPNKFVIKQNPNNNNKELLIIILITNTLLIIGYNVINYIYFICSNKVYMITWYEAYEAINKEKYEIINKSIKYKYSKTIIYVIFLFQNFVLFQNIELYINNKYIFKIVITCTIIFIFIVSFFMALHNYNYSNLINIIVDILIFYCFYSIILDYFVYLFDNHLIINSITEIIYILVKILISFLSYISLKEKMKRKYLKNNINEVLFEEKNKKKDESTLINCLLYLNEIMIKIKEKNEVKSAYLLISFFTEHINNCHKVFCNCHILQIFLQKDSNEYKVKPGDKGGILDDSKNHIKDLLYILNYLYESIFVEYDYYNKYYLSILLSEHFCHLRNNPTMAFSIITTLIMKKKEKLKVEQLIVLYELSQKYIYFILAERKNKLEKEINKNNKVMDLIIIQQKNEYFKKYFNTLNLAYKVKKIIFNYIDNEIKILKNKNLFEEAIEFKFDENEEISRVYIKFFKEESILKKNYTEKEMKKIKKLNSNILSCYENNNLFYIVSLLKNEQYDYNKIVNSIETIEIYKGIPVILIFKYYLFFDLFEGGKVPPNISNKLNMAFSNFNGLYSNNITSTTYTLLIKKLKNQNYLKNSKYYTIFQYKKEFRIKYFNETFALMLGYKQKDIINEKIDVLMPKEVCKSHQNMIKRLLIYEQLNYINPEKGFVFDSKGTIIYTIKVEGIMVYELSRYLMFISEISFFPDNEYRFMLDNNFGLLAHSKNFENEYSLNYNIFQNFNLKIIDIFKIKPSKLYNQFSEVLKDIHYQKYIRQAKVEEYFIPQLFVPQGDKNIGIMNPNYFNSIKNTILSKMTGKNKENNNNLIENKNDKEDEIDKLINNEKSQKVINDFFVNSGKIIFHSTYNITLSKKKFLQNLAKELSKIPDTDLMFEGDKVNYNLIMTSKNLIQKLLVKKELNNNYINIEVKLKYFYDKPFYFISVYDKKKYHFKLNKSELSLNSIAFSSINTNNLVKFTKNYNKTHNKIVTIKNKVLKKQNNNPINIDKKKELNNIEKNNKLFKDNSKKNSNSINNSISIIEKNEINYDPLESFGTDKILDKIQKYEKQINNVKFITLIKYILSTICIVVIIIYIIIMDYERNVIELLHKAFQCYYYNLYNKNIILHFQTVIIEKFYDMSRIVDNDFTTEEDYRYAIKLLTPYLKEGFHYFTNCYYSYNLEIGHNFNLMFRKREYHKLGGFWKEISYESDFPTEMDFLIYNIYSILEMNDEQAQIESDIKNFLFKNGIDKSKTKVYSNFIKLLYYFVVNYELTWSEIFDNIDRIIMDNYRNYVDAKLKKYYVLEVIGLTFIVIFFIFVLVYLYYANSIIIKNIILLFLDLTDDKHQSNKNNNAKTMIMKLIEFKNCISDFCLEKLNNYAKNLENIEQNTNNTSSILTTYVGVNSTFEKSFSANTDKNSINSNDKKSISFNKIEAVKKKESIKGGIYSIKDDSSSINNSSFNYLNRTKSNILKDQLNNNLISISNQTSTISNNNIGGTSNQLIINTPLLNNINNKNDIPHTSNKLYKKNKRDNIYIDINFDNKNNNDFNESIQDIILNKSNKDYILLIRIYSIIIYILTIMIIVYSIYKLINTVNFLNHYENIYYVYKILTNRYTSLNYYYNALKATIIFPFEKQMNSLDDLLSKLEDSNEKYDKIINNDLNKFEEVKLLFDIIKDSKNNSTEFLINKICYGVDICTKYIYSPYNIMDVGIDFLYKSILIDINKFYLDYTHLKDKKNIEKIQELIVNSRFISTGLYIEYAYNYIKFAIYNSFKNDEEKFKNKFIVNMGYFNIITVIFSIFSFLFVVVFIFLTISIYAEPIKKASYRISCSFYYIKKYYFSINKKTISQ